MRYIAVDDKPFALEDLQVALREAEPGCSITCFTSPNQALSYTQTVYLDVAFLDIELGSMNGLVLAKQIKDIQPHIHIIFITGYEQYALGAFQIHATGYLMKPATVEDINPWAVNRYRHDYLPNYSWAEFGIAKLEHMLER